MDKKKFQDYNDEQRLSLLKDNASSLLEDYGYEKPLTDQQVEDLKNKIANCVSELRKEKLNKSASMKAYTEFKGKAKQKFTVEIDIDPVSLWVNLVSPDAQDLIVEQRDQLIDEVLSQIEIQYPEIAIVEV